MKVIVFDTAEQAAEYGASLIAGIFRDHPRGVIGLATGSSPQPLYAALAARAGTDVDFSGLSGFALDEYVGIPLEHPESYHSIVHRDVVAPLGLSPERVMVPDGLAPDVDASALAYDRSIRTAGGIDLQILGIGKNGHVGFNEPGSSLASRTRQARLTDDTITANARFFASRDDVPQYCVTQGIGTIMEARALLLVANGRQKAVALAAAIDGPVTSNCPASVLQLHGDATILLDAEAASALSDVDQYRLTLSVVTGD
jgi:glucosamine-6-phosphate deaminase